MGTGGDERVILAHGGGGELMHRLLAERVFPKFGGASDGPATDGAVLPQLDGMPVFTTDSYVVTPLEFPGGDIGRLAVCGTVNDLAVMGATPVALSLGLILEEGLELATLERVLESIARAAREAGVRIVTGDTKVIDRRQAEGEPGMFVNTAGVGVLRPGARIGVERIEAGDAILINGNLADHGLAVMSRRNGLEFETALASDAAPLHGLIARLLDGGVDVKFMRDATRGGVAGVLADVSADARLSVEVEESALPISATARHAAEMLGLDPLTVANEGKVVFVVAQADADRALGLLHDDGYGRNATCIGWVTGEQPALVELVTVAGGRRVVQRPYGEDLPRIC